MGMLSNNLAMGILESCEGHDTSMRVSLDERLFRGPNVPNFGSEDYYFKEAKVKLFGDLLYKRAQGKTEFVLQTMVSNRGSKVITHSLRIYEDASIFLEERKLKLRIETPLNDPNVLGARYYICKLEGKKNEILLKTISFNRYEDEAFKRGLYEVAMLQKSLKEEDNRYGYTYQEAFVVESGMDKDKQDKCLIILGDYSSATLHELITYRKTSKMNWTAGQYESLCFQLIKGLLDLHRSRIAHRDIRPHNVCYCPNKHGYVIGGLERAMEVEKERLDKVGYSLCGVPYFLPSYLVDIGKREDYSEYYNYDPFKNDIHALGVTLMNCLFLDEFTPPTVLADSLQKYYTQFPFLKLIREMVGQNPPSLADILTTLSGGEGWLQQKSNIEALRFRLNPQDDEFVARKKLIAEGYYSMFLYDEWTNQINEIVSYYELSGNHLQLGDVYQQIAHIYLEHAQTELMQEYFHKASATYLKISGECLEEGKTEEGVKYLEKGIDCNRRGYQGQPNHDLAHLLNRLALAYHKKGEYDVARAFQEESVDIIGKVYGTTSVQYAEMLIDSAKIESQFQEFKQAENMLKAGLKIMDKKDDATDNLRIRAKLLQGLGSNYRMKALQRKEKSESYRKRAEECLLDGLQLAERVEGNISPQVGSLLMALGNVYFDKREFQKARKSYEKALIVKQHASARKQSVEVGECLTYLANSEKCLKEYEKAIKHYDEAVEVFRRAYGNDHNENTAVAIGNLGLVYKQLGRREQEREYLSLAKSILKDLFGEQCPDYQYFDRQSR